MANEDWLQPQRALDMLVSGGTQPPEAWHIVADAMRLGRLRCRAASIVTHFEGEPYYQQIDHEVPCDAWALGGVPLPGHVFWSQGDVNLLLIMLPMEVRGARLSLAGAELLVFDQLERLRPNNSELKKAPSKGLLPPDDEIEAMMMQLINGGLGRDEAAKRIKYQLGYEAVTNEHARATVRGKLPLGRPRKSRSVPSGKTA